MNTLLQIHLDGSAALLAINAVGRVFEKRTVRDFSEVTAERNRFVVLIPGQHVLLTTAQLPKTNRRELLKAVPFALEERLASDVDKLHFVLSDQQENNQWAVAAIDKNILKNYLHKLELHAISPVAIIPDYLALPYEPGAWTIALDHRMARVRTGKVSGFSTDANHLSMVLSLMLDCKNVITPQRITVFSDNKLLMPSTSHIQSRILLTIRSEDEIDYSALLSELPINLSPTKYRTIAGLRNRWRMALFAGTTWVFVLFATQIIEGIYWHVRSHQLHQEITTVYHAIFPGVADVVEPRLQIQRELRTLSQYGRGNHFVRVVGRVASVLHRYPEIRISALTYQNYELMLQLSADNLSSLESLTRALQHAGLSVKQNEMNSKDKSFFAEIGVK